MKKAISFSIITAAFGLSGCATTGYDGCLGVGCTVDKPDQFHSSSNTYQGTIVQVPAIQANTH